MKAIAAVVAILLIYLVPPALADGKKDVQTKGVIPIPEISIPDPVFKFKNVLEGEMVAHTFQVENTGGASLMIMNIKTTCGCTAASYTKEAIPPGERGEVTLQFNSRGYGGQGVTKTAYVFSNDPKSSKAALRLIGNVVKLANITPESVTLHGSLGEVVRAIIEIIPSEEFPFHIIGEPETGKDTYRCTIEKNGGKYILTAENLAKKPMVYVDSIVLKTDRSEKPEIRIRVFGKIEAKNQP